MASIYLLPLRLQSDTRKEAARHVGHINLLITHKFPLTNSTGESGHCFAKSMEAEHSKEKLLECGSPTNGKTKNCSARPLLCLPEKRPKLKC